MDITEISSKIWNRQTSAKTPEERRVLSQIGISLRTLDHCVTQFVDGTQAQHSRVGNGKLFIMELWTIRSFLLHLDRDVKELDNLVPRLQDWRDSYAHILERVLNFAHPFRLQPADLQWATNSLAGGKLTSSNDGYWEAVNLQGVCNFEFDGSLGARAIFGLIDNYLICNSTSEPLEVEIDQGLFQKILTCLDNLL